MTEMIIERVARAVAGCADAGEFSGVVLLQRDGVDLFADAQGWAVRGHRVPNRVDTRRGRASDPLWPAG